MTDLILWMQHASFHVILITKFLCCFIAAVIVSLVTGETEFDYLKIKLEHNRMGKQRNFSLQVLSQNTTQRKHALTYMMQSVM